MKYLLLITFFTSNLLLANSKLNYCLKLHTLEDHHYNKTKKNVIQSFRKGLQGDYRWFKCDFGNSTYIMDMYGYRTDINNLTLIQYFFNDKTKNKNTIDFDYFISEELLENELLLNALNIENQKNNNKILIEFKLKPSYEKSYIFENNKMILKSYSDSKNK